MDEKSKDTLGYRWRYWAFAFVFLGITGIKGAPQVCLAALWHSTPQAASNSSDTVLTPVLNAPLPGQANVIWCGTFQLAWNDAITRLLGPIHLLPPSPTAEQLNSSHLFLHPYANLGSWPVGPKKVQCFGFLNTQSGTADLHKQTLVHRYQSPDDFTIELLPKQAQDRLILAKLPARGSLEETAYQALRTLRDAPPTATGRDVVVIPDIAFDITSPFAQLEGRGVVGVPGTTLRKAIQSVKLQMDEKGVELQSEAQVSFSCAAHPPPGRSFVLAPPFLLVMERRGAKVPYLVCWIANADLFK